MSVSFLIKSISRLRQRISCTRSLNIRIFLSPSCRREPTVKEIATTLRVEQTPVKDRRIIVSRHCFSNKFFVVVSSIIVTQSFSLMSHICTHLDSNNNGSYYYSNDNGSTYYNSGSGSSTYTAPSSSSGSSSQK